MTRDDLPEELSNLPPAIDPPPELEERVVGALRREGLLGAPPARRRPAPRRAAWWWAAAACLLAAVAGWTLRGVVDAPAGGGEAAHAAGNDYLLLLTAPAPLATDKPEAELVAEYRQWAVGLAREGRLVAAAKLDDEDPGRHLGATPAAPVGTVSGYFVVRGASLEEATALAAASPHRRYGGEIAVRPIEQTGE